MAAALQAVRRDVTRRDWRPSWSCPAARPGKYAAAGAAEVEAVTGYAVGGVAPVGHLAPCDIVADESLRRFETVFAAAGDSHTVFEAEPEALVARVGGQWAAITR